MITGGNFKNVVIIGSNNSTKRLEEFFNREKAYGYRFLGFFTNQSENDKLGNVNQSFEYVITNKINEIYCSINELSNTTIKEFIEFCDVNMIILKFISDGKEIYSKKPQYEYYDYIPILNLRTIPLNDYINKIIKRSFDIIFSSFVVVFVLSWLIPVIAILIKLESKGPVFFKQRRNGINNEEFECYKFRSMTPNDSSNTNQATKGDMRVTKMGKFIRKTSIDELPQFINVLFGDMSVVGPRPHMVSHTEKYSKIANKYMVRHFVKPGITGLAQVKGYRGEVITINDIVNRTKYDIFYIENWSLLLDLNIIVRTVLNILQGEEKAY